MLQIGVPPLRVDILNRADGITFDEAAADGDAFELGGRTIPVMVARLDEQHLDESRAEGDTAEDITGYVRGNVGAGPRGRA